MKELPPKPAPWRDPSVGRDNAIHARADMRHHPAGYYGASPRPEDRPRTDPCGARRARFDRLPRRRRHRVEQPRTRAVDEEAPAASALNLVRLLSIHRVTAQRAAT